MYRSQFLNHISILFYLIKHVIEPGVLQLSILAGLSSGRDPVYVPTVLELQICVALPEFYIESGGPTLIPMLVWQPLD